MRYAKDHKEKTRQRIVETAAQNFRERGFEGEGIASVMQAAGLTNGAFFNHFASKEDLAREVVNYAMDERLAFVDEKIAATGGIEGYVMSYLSTRHRDNPGLGCPVPSLAPEIARRSPPVREAFTKGVDGLVERIAAAFPALPHDEARAKAIALYGLVTGCLQLARATEDEALSLEVLEAGKKAALALIS